MKEAPAKDKEFLLEKSKVFCMAPWSHLQVKPNGEVFPCCMSAHEPRNAIGHLRKGDSLASAWNSDQMRKLRMNMLQGEGSSICQRCYAEEAVGQRSWRISGNQTLAHHFAMIEKTRDQGFVDEVNLPYLDIRFSNVCNLKCRICSPTYSTSWHSDGVAMGSIKSDVPAIKTATADPDVLWQQIVPLIPHVERLHFAGGEPLVMEEHYRILDLLQQKERFNVQLSYNTNFSKLHYRHYDVVKVWKQFPRIHLQASLDGIGARGDYMRKGQDWEQIVHNRIRTLQECPHIEFRVLATVSIMNALHMPDFYKEWFEKGYITPNGMQLNILFQPSRFNIRGLPSEFKKRVEEKYRDFIDNYLDRLGAKAKLARDYFESVLRYMSAEDWNVMHEFRQYTKELDILRSERFQDIFPELADLVAPSRCIDDLYSGLAKKKFGRIDEAMSDFDRAIDEIETLTAESRQTHITEASGLDAAMVQAYVERGQLRRAQGDHTGARQDFASAAALEVTLAKTFEREFVQREPRSMEDARPNPSLTINADTFVERGRSKRAQGDAPGALQDFTQAIALDSGLVQAYVERGQLHRALGDNQGALEDFARAAELHPSAALDHLNKQLTEPGGDVLQPLQGSSPKQLIEEDIRTQRAYVYYLRGIAKRALRDNEGALSDFDSALDMVPSFTLAERAKAELNASVSRRPC